MANKTIDQLPTKANPVDADLLVIADSQDNNEMKQITIGSITADIGDGLIVDGSASTTTTYSSTKINTDNATQDAALTAWLALKANKAWDTFTWLVSLNKGSDIASATALPLGTATGNYVDVTGTTTVTSITAPASGNMQIFTRFTGILTLTHNATSLILPTGANITTTVWDVAQWVYLGSNNWRCVSYTRADGTPLGGVSITSLTEDTTGDMTADFLLAYDNSASGNRKQKPQVYSATDAEADSWTVTNKWLLPSQNDKYSLSTNLRSDWYTTFAPMPYTGVSTMSGWSSVTMSATVSAGWYISMWGSTGVDFTTTTWLMGSWTTLDYSPAQSKDIRIKFRVKVDDTSDRKWFWMCVSAANIHTAQTDTTNWLIRFIINGASLFAHNANWTATSTDISSGITVTNWNTYEIVFNPWTDIKYYVNWTLRATHTNNLPTTGTLILAYWANTNGRVIKTTPPIISYEI